MVKGVVGSWPGSGGRREGVERCCRVAGCGLPADGVDGVPVERSGGFLLLPRGKRKEWVGGLAALCGAVVLPHCCRNWSAVNTKSPSRLCEKPPVSWTSKLTSRKREVFVQYVFTVSNGGYVLGQQNMKSFSMPRLRKRILIPPPILTACVAAGIKHEHSGWLEV